MAQDPLTQKLVKANGDLGKLCDFFAGHAGWSAADDADRAARDLAAAAAAFDEHLRVLIQVCGAETAPPDHHGTTDSGSGTLDAARLARFAGFLRDLDAWLVAQPGPTTDPEGIEALRTMQSRVAFLLAAAAGLAPDAAAAPAPAPEPETPRNEISDPTVGSGAAPAPTSGAGPQILVLDDTDEHPMVQEFQNRKELTPACEALVDGFLAAWEIDYAYTQRKRLLDRLLRWITSAPEGHVLVLKMKTAEEPHEPYPSYVSRDFLSTGTDDPDPAV